MVASPARPLSVLSADGATPSTPYKLRELEEGEIVEAITPPTNVVASPPPSSSTASPEVSDSIVDTYAGYGEDDELWIEVQDGWLWVRDRNPN